MRIRSAVQAVTVTVMLLAVSACSQAPETPPPLPTPAPASTAAPAATVAPTPTSAPSPTTAPTAVPLSAMAKKAAEASEYTFDSTITVAGRTVTSHHAVKGSSLRQEMSAGGMRTVLLIDGSAGTAYMLMPAENVAMRIDFRQAMEQVDDPGEWVESLPASARQVGTETVDGKEATVYEVTEGINKGRFWLWTERGLPLKIEAESPDGPVSVLFTDYRFEPVPDSAFELPPDTEVVEMPAGVPGGAPPKAP